jgi:hypothetical protein
MLYSKKEHDRSTVRAMLGGHLSDAEVDAIVAVKELDPWLADYMDGEMLRHPLLYSYSAPLYPGVANKQVGLKQDAINDALRRKRWYSAICLFERPYRADALMMIASTHRIVGADYWELVGSVWTDSENIWQHTDEWKAIFHSRRKHREMVMDEDERAELASLPSTLPIIVYRGCKEHVNEQSLSWTTNPDTAIWFATRFASTGSHRGNGQPLVLVGRVMRDDVLALFNGRGESEIVSERVEIIERELIGYPLGDTNIQFGEAVPS